MTAAPSGHHPVMETPPCTPAAVRAVLAENADPAVLGAYDRDLDKAFERSRQDGDLTPLVETVRAWWFQADQWRDPDARHAFQQRVDRYLSDGPPPSQERMSREDIRARYGV